MSEENKDQLGQGTPTPSEHKVEQELSPQDLEKVAGGATGVEYVPILSPVKK